MLKRDDVLTIRSRAVAGREGRGRVPGWGIQNGYVRGTVMRGGGYLALLKYSPFGPDRRRRHRAKGRKAAGGGGAPAAPLPPKPSRPALTGRYACRGEPVSHSANRRWTCISLILKGQFWFLGTDV